MRKQDVATLGFIVMASPVRNVGSRLRDVTQVFGGAPAVGQSIVGRVTTVRDGQNETAS